MLGKLFPLGNKIQVSTLPRKALLELNTAGTVPQTDTGGLVLEYQGERVSPP